MNNKRMKRAILKRKIKIAVLSIVLALIVWILINNLIQCSAETKEQKIYYQEFNRQECVQPRYSTAVSGIVVMTTAYCDCEKCCGEWVNKRCGSVVGASGKELIPGYSIAADQRLFKYGDILTIDGMEYRVDDCGGAIKGFKFDVFLSNHKEAIEYGVQYRILEFLED